MPLPSAAGLSRPVPENRRDLSLLEGIDLLKRHWVLPDNEKVFA